MKRADARAVRVLLDALAVRTLSKAHPGGTTTLAGQRHIAIIWEMARQQTLVQLTDELVAMLDELAASTKRSRSELIREALRVYLHDEARARTDARLVDAYTTSPESDEEVAAAEVALRESIAEEPW